MRQTDSTKNNSVIKPLITMLTAALFFAFIYDLSTESIKDASYIFLIVCTVLILVLFRNRISYTGTFFVMLSGMILKLTYVIYTPVWCRQHDVVDFGAGEGHAAYIEYILEHRALPDFDPRSIWAFFQPPLHHVISAVWMWFNIRMKLPEARIYKNVQILPLMYMCVLMYIVYLICRELCMKKGGTFITMLIVSFHPIYILMSGSINNDALSVMLSVAAIYAAIIWYMYPTTARIILLGVLIGLAMMAKMSSALVAPPVAVMMVYKIMKDTGKLSDRTKVISYVLELIAFAVVVFPLGLWWTIRNKILFGMGINYIPEVGEHVEKWGFVPTILDVGTASPYLYMKSNGFVHDEYNMILACVKSSLFGEGDFISLPQLITAFAWILFFANIAVIILWIISMIRTCIVSETGPDKGIKLFLVCTVISYVAGFVAFAVSGKNLSAMDFRYSAATVAVMSVFLGLWYDRLGAVGGKTAKCVIMAVSGVFAASAAVFWILVGLA